MNDIDQNTQQQTDKVTERIFGEWSWLEGIKDEKSRTEMRDLQNQWMQLRDEMTQTDNHMSEEQKLEKKENIIVLEKKMKAKRLALLEQLNV